ncbi:ATP-binding cassette domain-containing protein, partial [Staphylococcus aureus]
PTELQLHVTEPLPAGAQVLEVDGAVLLPGSEPLNLEVAAGQVTGILGLLGAGKTDLAELIAGVRVDGDARLRLDGAPY